MKTKNPEGRYHLAYDKLYVEDKCFVWSESLGKVVMLENENTPGDISLVTDSRDPSLSPKRTNSPKRQECVFLYFYSTYCV